MSDRIRRVLLVFAASLVCGCTTPSFAPRGLPGNVNAPPPDLATADESLLTYALWVWQETQLANGTRIVPDKVGSYTVEFRPDNTVSVNADCNHGSGKYVQSGARLTISSIALTRVACPPGSREGEFLKGLNAVAEQTLRDSDLVLSLRDGAGTMRFSVPRR